MIGYTVKITDTVTGETREWWHSGPWEEQHDFWWREGNFACGCNRSRVWRWAVGPVPGDMWPFDDAPCGEGRYRVACYDGDTLLYEDDPA